MFYIKFFIIQYNLYSYEEFTDNSFISNIMKYLYLSHINI